LVVLLKRANYLIETRDRLRACEIAGVAQKFETVDFPDDDAVKDFIADKSEHRVQQAMRLALLYPEAKHGGARKCPLTSTPVEKERAGRA
jgi:hypothetical protein